MKKIHIDEPTKLYRWILLFFTSLLTLGSYFAYDSIGPIAPMLKERLAIGSEEIGWMYSIYSLPNLIMVLIGGVLLDRMGTRVGAFIYAAVVAAGAGLTATGTYLHSVPDLIRVFLPENWPPEFFWMFLGRFLFGVGSESLIIAQSTIIAKWFKGKELAFAFGINLTFCRLGTFGAFNSVSRVAEAYQSIHPALWLAFVVCIISVLAAVVYISMEIHAESRYGRRQSAKSDKLIFGDILRFKPSFWLVSVLCVTFYSAVFPFTAFSTDLFVEKWQLTQSTASSISSIIIFMSMIFTPVFGYMVDRIGRRATFMIFGSLMLIPVYLTLALTRIHPAIPMAVLGISFSLVPAAMWPSIPFIVEERRLGTAYGLMTLIQNVGLFFFPILIGTVRDRTGNYTASMLIFSLLGFLGLFFSVLLRREENGPHSSGLEKSELNRH
jgi:MFS family permease